MNDIEFGLLRTYEEHDDSLILRRYLNLEKFNDFIVSRTLYFAPTSAFKDKDKLEGHYTKFDYRSWNKQLSHWGLCKKDRNGAARAKMEVAQHNQKAVVISCWTKGAAEGRRMWKRYKADVAIETNVRDLRASIGPAFLIIPVKYYDSKRDTIPKDHSLQPFFYKRLCYSWEKEIRVIGEMELGKQIGTPRRVPINPERLVHRIIASQKCFESISQLVSEHSLCIPVEASTVK
jgi:hypothetical protein